MPVQALPRSDAFPPRSGGYLKAFYLEREPAIDMVADDLATLSLDDAVDQDGFQRTGLNPFALPDEAAGSV